jgi:uncharacterized protein YdeI (YjbR/CyaY-like superfamily)
MPMPNEESILVCDDAEAFEAWLAEHHADRTEVWVRLAKKGAPAGSITRAEALDAALCWGWIDSQARRLDDHYTLQRYSPRRRTSPWSQVNVRRAEELIAAGRMRRPGQEQIDAAMADGRWSAAYAPQSESVVPDDLAAALVADPTAQAAFEALPKSQRYALILALAKTRTERGRAARIARTLADLKARTQPPP